MGLLDDAIREHLELKRRRGADPGEIAKVEREALEPVVPSEPATWGNDPSPQELGGHEDAPDQVYADADPAGPAEAAGDFPHVGQETAEIDMEAVLNGDADAAEPAVGRASGDSFEWEVPAEESEHEPPPEPIPGQERLSFE